MKATVTVQSITGSQGNLGTKVMPASIPSALRSVSALLHPIEAGILGQKIFFPGFLFFVTTVMEEDLSDNDDAEDARADVAGMIEGRINHFFNRSDFVQTLIARAAAQSNVAVSQLNSAHFAKALLSMLQELRQDIKNVIPHFVDFALGRGGIKVFGANWDPDDYIGSAVMLLEQTSVVTTSFQETIDDPEFDGRYALTGDIKADLLRSPFTRGGRVISNTEGGRGTHTIGPNDERLCVVAGHQIEWVRQHQVEEEDLFYPEIAAPIELEWRIEGQVLDFAHATVQFETFCAFPEFQASHLKGPISQGFNKNVSVQVTSVKEQDLDGLRLRNRPEDGNYYATVQVFAKVGATRQLLAQDTIAFEGQKISSPFYEIFRKCIGKYENVGERYAESARIGPKELWGPSMSGRIRWYEHQVKIADSFEATGKLSTGEVERIKTPFGKAVKSCRSP